MMHLTKKRMGLAAAIAGSIAMLAGCGVVDKYERRVLGVVDIEVVAGQTYKDPSVASFVVEGGDEDVHLTRVITPSAITTRIVDANGNNISQGVAIPKRSKIAFGLGKDYRVEFDQVNLIPRKVGEIELTFVFTKGEPQIATVPFITPEGAQAPTE